MRALEWLILSESFEDMQIVMEDEHRMLGLKLGLELGLE